jgi:hypothetical protein
MRAVTATVLTAALVAVAALTPAAPALADPEPAGRVGRCTAADENAVTIVVDYQDLGRGADIYCASNLTPTTTGAEALRLVGVEVTGTSQAGAEFMCRLNGLPAPDQLVGTTSDPSYVETCVTTPPQSAYWTYWQAQPGGDWTYSLRGYGISRVNLGGFEGYSFSHNVDATDGARPGVAPAPPADEVLCTVGDASTAPTCGPSGPAAPGSPSPGPAAGRFPWSSPSTTTLITLGAVLLVILAAAAVAARRGRKG